jgi:hypothetical protein
LINLINVTLDEKKKNAMASLIYGYCFLKEIGGTGGVSFFSKK